MHTMRKVPSTFTWTLAATIGVGTLLSMQTRAQQEPGQDISASALQQMAEVTAMKRGLSDAETKLESSLLYAEKAASGQIPGAASSRLSIAGAENVDVDIYGTISDGLLSDIASVGGTIVYAAAQWGTVRATLPLTALPAVAANADVNSIRAAGQAVTNAGGLTSQGYVT